MSHAMEYTLFLFLLLDLTNFFQAQTFNTILVDYPRAFVPFNQYCNVMMKSRNFNIRRQCRSNDTFIHDSFISLKELCQTAFVPCGNGLKQCHQSSPVNVTHCLLLPNTHYPDCQYSMKFQEQKIKIICWKNRPFYLVP
ncbi:ribonuclease pancreatic-like [Gracilinanus agilis]|uniref:ribonuclease pancreatic-like n=1 Tax=Gracilinanus agilis TaxID=191870 RepID=UPI001CFD8754|nr:ribonuclease pancreatic-like [Gracilinanus agilis]